MAVAFHNSSTGTTHNPAVASTVTITKPTVSAGDVLVCEFGNNGGTTAQSMTAPAGWTQIGSTISSTKVKTQAWWALQSVAALGFTVGADGAGSSDVSWTCLSFSGVDNTTPIDATGTGNSNTGANNVTPANYTDVTDGALPLVAITNWNGGGVFTSTGFTVVPSATTNCQTATLYANAAVSGAGATVTGVQINDSASATGNILCYQQFALRPAASAASYLPNDLAHAPRFQPLLAT